MAERNPFEVHRHIVDNNIVGICRNRFDSSKNLILHFQYKASFAEIDFLRPAPTSKKCPFILKNCEPLCNTYRKNLVQNESIAKPCHYFMYLINRISPAFNEKSCDI